VHVTSAPSTENLRISLSLHNLRTVIRHGLENMKLIMVDPEGTAS